MRKLLISAILATTTITSAGACDRSSFAATLIVYDQVCSKLPAGLLAAYKKELEPYDLSEAQNSAKSDTAFCKNNEPDVMSAVALFKKSHRIGNC
jgi:hypothetical protein